MAQSAVLDAEKLTERELCVVATTSYSPAPFIGLILTWLSMLVKPVPCVMVSLPGTLAATAPIIKSFEFKVDKLTDIDVPLPLPDIGEDKLGSKGFGVLAPLIPKTFTVHWMLDVSVTVTAPEKTVDEMAYHVSILVSVP
jgi:hypothetical protein